MSSPANTARCAKIPAPKRSQLEQSHSIVWRGGTPRGGKFLITAGGSRDGPVAIAQPLSTRTASPHVIPWIGRVSYAKVRTFNEAIGLTIAKKLELSANLRAKNNVSSKKVWANGGLIAAARQYLRISQARLATLAEVAEATLVTFEKGTRLPHEATREKIQGILEARGIVFTNGDRPGFYFDKEKAIIPS